MTGYANSDLGADKNTGETVRWDVALAKKGARWAAIVAAAGIVAACSSIPDAVNPVEWYRGTVDYFFDDEVVTETESQASQTARADAKNATYPNINQTTERPAVMSDADRRKMAKGLVADKAAGRYAAGNISRQGDAGSPLASGPAVEGSTQVTRQDVPLAAPVVSPSPLAAPVTQAPKAPQMAAAPKGGAAASMAAPARRASVADIYRANLMQRRPVDDGTGYVEPVIHFTAPRAPMRSANYPGSPVGGDFETLVISGDGIENESFTAAYPQRSAAVGAIRPKPLRVIVNGQARSLGDFPAGAFRNSFKVATLQFNAGSAQLSQREQGILARVVQLHRERGGKVRVIGHASSRTRDMGLEDHLQVNYNVSVDRADRVAQILVSSGVKANDLFVGAVADSQPQYSEVMPSGEAGNRRTEIYIDY